MESRDIKNENFFPYLEQYPDILSPKDLIEILPLGKNRVYELLESNVIKNKKFGRKYIIAKVSVIDFLQKELVYCDGGD